MDNIIFVTNQTECPGFEHSKVTIIIGTACGALAVILILVIPIITAICCKNKLNKSIEKGNEKITEDIDDVKCAVKEGQSEIKAQSQTITEMRDVLMSFIESAGRTSQHNRNKPSEVCRIEDDHGPAVELGEVNKEDFGALVSLVSDSLSSALENPLISDEVKKSVDSVVKKYWKDVL